jgi:hypothetical protein
VLKHSRGPAERGFPSELGTQSWDFPMSLEPPSLLSFRPCPDFRLDLWGARGRGTQSVLVDFDDLAARCGSADDPDAGAGDAEVRGEQFNHLGVGLAVFGRRMDADSVFPVTGWLDARPRRPRLDLYGNSQWFNQSLSTKIKVIAVGDRCQQRYLFTSFNSAGQLTMTVSGCEAPETPGCRPPTGPSRSR